MSRPVRAHHIVIDRQQGRVIAVYPSNTPRANLMSIGQQLKRMTNAPVAVSRVALETSDGKQAMALIMDVTRLGKLDRALKAFKSLTNPLLPVALGVFSVEMLICGCGRYGSRVDDYRFVIGFEPPDEEAFLLRYAAAIKRKPLGELLSIDPKPPYLKVAKAIEDALEEVGGFTTELQIRPLNVGPCTHSR